MAPWSLAGDSSLLHCSINGLTEWDGTWYRHVRRRPAELPQQQQLAWSPSGDHGSRPRLLPRLLPLPKFPPTHATANARCTQTSAGRADLELHRRFFRLGPQSAPTSRHLSRWSSLPLQQVDRNSGFLIHPRAIEEILGTKWFAFRQDENGAYQTIQWPEEVTPVYDSEQGIIPFEDLIKHAKDVPVAEQADYMWIASAAAA